jgi:hypothetical protein
VRQFSRSILLFAVSGFLSVKAQQSQVSDWIKHLRIAQELTLAVAAAMPDEDYSFKPNPEEMFFGEQLDHLARAQAGACARVTDAKNPVAKPETIDKISVTKEISTAYEFCLSSLSNSNDSQLDKTVGPAGHQMPVREALLSSLCMRLITAGSSKCISESKTSNHLNTGFRGIL